MGLVGDTGLFCVWGLRVRVVSSVAEEGDLQSVAVSAWVQTASQKPEEHSRERVSGKRGREAYLLPVPAFTMSLLKDVFLCVEQYIH